MASVPTPSEPLSLEETKAHLRVDDDDSDDLIAALITAAREHVEDYTGLLLVPCSITETAPRLGRDIQLASFPVTSVDAIRYPVGGTMTALAAGSWLVSLATRPARVLPASWGWGVSSGTSALGFLARAPFLPVEIDITAGFATPDDVPNTIKQAMLLLVAHWYGNRQAAEVGVRAAAIEVPFAVEALLRRWRFRSL